MADIKDKVDESDSSQQLMIDAFASVCDFNSALYIAGPLATGLNFYQRTASGQNTDDIRPHNETKMRDLVAKIRREQSRPVIDPSIIRIPNWTPRKIGDFYLKVIELFVCEIRLMDGWEYSSGATKEVWRSILFGKNICDIAGRPLHKEDLGASVQAAALVLDRLGISAHKLHERHECIVTAGKKLTY